MPGLLDDEPRGPAALPGGSPVVGRDVDPSVPGLFVAGLITATATALGPATRFVHGAGFTEDTRTRAPGSRRAR
ncbi:hypothetical protein [Streptomyces sp. NPDC096324]|uniref:hypothetical protein n=1 Tax=Streptomyces sp. NPDC096324 TaxID=3366085 RepID=UPI0037F10C7F